jgi:WD40 repeat protein
MLARIILIYLFLSSFVSNAQQIETVVQRGHELAVVTLSVSADSNYVATGSKDKSIKLWEIKTGREIRSFLGHEMTVTTVRFTPNGKYLISGSNDKTVRIWEVATGKNVTTIYVNDYIHQVATDPAMKYIVVGGYSDSGHPDSAMIYDFKTKLLVKKIHVNSRSAGLNIQFSPDGHYLAFGEDNHMVNIYDTKTWKQTYRFQQDEGWCGGCLAAFSFSPDSKYVFVGSYKAPLKQYELATQKLVASFEESCPELTSLVVSKDGKRLARASENNITVWDISTHVKIADFDAPEKGLFHEIEFEHDGKGLWISSDNNTAFRYNFRNKASDKSLTGFLNQRDPGGLNYDPNFYWQANIARFLRFKNSILITNDGKSLIKGRFGTKLRRWDIATGKPMMEYVGHQKTPLAYTLTKDGKRMASGDGDGRIYIWDVAKGDTLLRIDAYRDPIFDIRYNHNETQLISCSWDARVKIHDVRTGKMLSVIDFQNTAAYVAAFHPSDLYIITGKLDHSLQLFEIDTRKEVRNFIGHTNIISMIQISSDAKTLLSSSWDGSIRLWDIASGLMTKKFTTNTGPIYTALFHQSDQTIFAAGADRVIREWNIQTGTVTRSFEGHQADITSLQFTPDKKILISHSVDGVTKLWDLSTNKEFFEHIHVGTNNWMAKTPEGFFNSTAEARKYIHFVRGIETYSVDQFFNNYYRPEILPQLFQQRNKVDENKSIQGKLSKSPPPIVQIAVIDLENGKAEVVVRLTDQGQGVQNLRILHNGKSIPLDKDKIVYPTAQKKSSTFQLEVEMIGGSNTFSAIAGNKDNFESDPQTVELFNTFSTRSSTCHVLTIGINDYKNSKLSLNYAQSDAQAFTNVIKRNSQSLFKEVVQHTLYNQQATKENILQKLDALAKVIHPEDVFILYYAGHGSLIEDKFYFIPTEGVRLYDANALQKESIEASVIQEKLKHIKALKQLIIMDACQSGGSVELLASRGAGEERAIAQLSRTAGIHVMAAAGSEQFASEFTELGHGVFTYVLLEALEGAADGAPKDGKVTIYELKSYIDDQVPEKSKHLKGKPQYPFTFSRGQDFPIVIQER